MKKLLQKIIFYILTTFILFNIKSVAFAHSKMLSTVPQHQTTVKSPQQITMNFAKKIRITKIVLIKQDKPIQKFVADKKFVKTFNFTLNQVLEIGKYTVKWRGLGIDGHPMQGEFSFNVM